MRDIANADACFSFNTSSATSCRRNARCDFCSTYEYAIGALYQMPGTSILLLLANNTHGVSLTPQYTSRLALMAVFWRGSLSSAFFNY